MASVRACHFRLNCQAQPTKKNFSAKSRSNLESASFLSNLFDQRLNNTMTSPHSKRKRVTLQVSNSLHRKIKKLSQEREETVTQLVHAVIHEFLLEESFYHHKKSIPGPSQRLLHIHS
jgi:hypothetical protein